MEPGLEHSFKLQKYDTNRGEKEKHSLTALNFMYISFKIKNSDILTKIYFKNTSALIIFTWNNTK